MNQRSITLCYRKIIDFHSEKPWEKLLFEDTYNEFKMQFQLYNREKKYYNFSELVHAVPSAQQLHFLVSAAAAGYIRQLGMQVPDIKNNLGLSFLSFSNFRFEIIQSDIRNKASHTVAVNFISEPMRWLDTVGNYLLLAENKKTELSDTKTEMVMMQPFLSICSLQNEGG